MQNKNAIITGASRGIGLAVAQAFAAAGYNVAVCATKHEALEKAKQNLESHGVKVYAELVDVSQPLQCQAFVDNAVKNLGGVDVLVNNAGITKDNLAVRMSEEDWDNVLDVNLKGTFFMSKAALKYMMKARSGSIVNLTSIVGQAGNFGQANYSASKAGIIGLTKSLAKEFASRGITVNAVAPGFVETEMTGALDEQLKEKMLESVPLKRFASVADIAKAILFLASEDASYITGQILAVNGGLYI
ncbi:3-oxoacyl-[acyl-carrier protein] reductase [Elusimicrobium posterum]|uniref:3-oxoacyl-[acyl-carrier-protein] reductase n=1 Tax=Elusimicrobium posterum TaxID=3116653 RepID=UPI003C76F080